MTATLEQIHQDPAILDRAIASQEPLNIVAEGKIAATLVPQPAAGDIEEAREWMRQKFAAPDWKFSAEPMTRDERNSRG